MGKKAGGRVCIKNTVVDVKGQAKGGACTKEKFRPIQSNTLLFVVKYVVRKNTLIIITQPSGFV